ncbi:MAG: RraA family protein [Candidatus Tectomicrobia bacterium]|uniref:Putative 4-hydroxy-4-methyl-2-oxoglutarate aldolase n=1 Tax=Tectimicrobiota bacterium TaxID=2528274 RepID=A0A932GMJ0_UNCTE|nr:RraA family protein [Candidatus Tectomicrobia bacterium]
MENNTKELVRQFAELSTATVSDALDRFGIKGGCEGIVPIGQGMRLLGPAFTVRYLPVGVVKGTVGDYIDDVQPGEVVVLDNGGRLFCTVWGDILTIFAKIKGVAGTVIDGVCRDVPAILAEGYPVFSRGKFVMTGKDRVEVAGVQVPVSLGNVQVKPGDIVFGDDSGVIVIPAEKAREVLDAALEIERAEKGIEEMLRQGYTIREARQKYQYHSLQSKK